MRRFVTPKSSSKMPDLRHRVHVHVRNSRRVSRVDHRLGSRARIRAGRRHREHRVVGLFHEHSAPGVADARTGWVSIPPEWTNGPIGDLPVRPAFRATPIYPRRPSFLLITALLIRGTKESGAVNAVIVAVKLAIVMFFISSGWDTLDGPTTPAAGPVPGDRRIFSVRLGPGCSVVRPSSSLRTLASMPYRRRPKRPRTPAGTCLSASS